MQRGATLPVVARYHAALIEVVQELRFQLLRNLPVVQQRRHFEIVFETADIHIGRAVAADPSVYGNTLGMEESVLIYIHPGSVIQKFSRIGAGGPVYKGVVRLARYHETYIHA